MGTVSVSLPADGSTADVSDYNTPITTIVNEFNGNIDNANIKTAAAIDGSKLATSTVGATQLNFAATGANNGIWWEELGRTTSTGASSISVASFSARKYLKVMAYWHPSLASAVGVTFNSDTAANYARRDSTNGATDASAGSLTNVLQAGGSATPTLLTFDVINNNAVDEKMVYGSSLEQNTAGAANVPARREHVGKWANTSAQITTITLTVSSGTLGAAELVILGHN